MTFDPKKKLPDGIEGRIAAYLLKYVPKEALAAEERREQHPDEPWLWETGEVSTSIHPYSGDQVKSAWVGAFFLNFFAWFPIPFAFNQNVIAKYPWSQIFILLPILASLSILRAAYRTLQAKIFAASPLRLDTFPVSAGTTLNCYIDVPVALRSADRVDITLTCYEAITTGTGDSKNTKTNPLWTATQALPWKREEYNAASPIPMQFELPNHIEGTSNPDSLYHQDTRKVYWSLWVIAFVHGISMRAKYKVPIYRTRDSPPMPPPDYTHITWQSMEAKLSPAGIYHSEDAIGRHRLTTRVPRGFSGLFGTAIIIGFFCVPSYVIPDGMQQISNWRVYRNLFLLFVILGAIRGLLFAETLEVSGEGLVLRSGTLGFRRARIYAPDDIESLPIGYWAASSKRCNIHLHTVQGQKTVLLHALPDRAAAEDLIALITSTMAISVPSAVIES